MRERNGTLTSTGGWAKELAPITAVFLANLVPLSAGADLLRRAMGLSLDGVAAVNVPTVTVPLAAGTCWRAARSGQ